MSRAESTIHRWRNGSLLAGVAGVACCAGIYAYDEQAFFRGYHVGFMFWWRVSMGFLALALLRTILRSYWGNATWMYLKASLWTLPVLAVAVIPIGIGLEYIFPWATEHSSNRSEIDDAAHAADDASTDHTTDHTSEHTNEFQAVYLKRDFFIQRIVGYFALWGLASVIVYRTGTSTGDVRWPRKLAGFAMMAHVLATTFAAFDWGMSLEPHWHSTIYGALLLVSGTVSALAIMVLTMTNVFRFSRIPGISIGQVTNDLGNLLLAFLMMWTYFSFSQFLIIWSGNLPTEVTWYLLRSEPLWFYTTLFLVGFHFVVPFFLLLSREHKRRPRRLARIAGLLLAANLVELVWTIMPSYEAASLLLLLATATSTAAIAGLWLAAYSAGLGHELAQEQSQ